MGDRSGTEQVGYSVVAQLDEATQVRDYGARVVAETEASTAEGDPSSTAFRRLFDYIQGANRSEAKIAMTAPVETGQASPSESIAMTAPVEVESENGTLRMAFFLPEGTTLDTAPVPTNTDVSLREVPSRLEAVRRFSGSRSDEHVMRETDALAATLAASDWQPVGEPRTYFYDPPWTLPWFRRNEVAVAVQGRENAA